MQHCNPQNLANMLWAYATLEVQPGQALLDAAALRMLDLLPSFKPQALANIAWAYATLGCNPGQPSFPALPRPAPPCCCTAALALWQGSCTTLTAHTAAACDDDVWSASPHGCAA